MREPIDIARAKAAALLPEYLIDTKGRKHKNIPRERILAGDWDKGNIVTRHLASADPHEEATT